MNILGSREKTGLFKNINHIQRKTLTFYYFSQQTSAFHFIITSRELNRNEINRAT